MQRTIQIAGVTADSNPVVDVGLVKHRGNVQISNLQVVWQFRSSSIAGVHSDTDITHWIQNQLGTLKLKRLYAGLHCTNYAQNLKMHKNRTL